MQKKAKSVLIVANYIHGKGGIANVVNNHYNNLNDIDCNVEIFNTKKNLFARLVLILPLIIKVKYYKNIHIHCCSYFGFYPAIIGVIAANFIPNRNIIVTYHGGGAERFLKKYHFFVKLILANADSVTVMSYFLEKTFSQYGIETQLVRNVIDIQINKDRPISFQTPKIVSIRNLSSNYNVSDICEAFLLIKDKYPVATLNIAGDGNDKIKLQKKYSKIENINFLGLLPYTDIIHVLTSNNIFISVPTSDNQPLSILEAMASGTIVITSKVGGIVDMIVDGKTGLLVEVNQPEKIAEKVDWILNNPISACEIVRNAFLEVQKYTWKEVGTKLINLYK